MKLDELYTVPGGQESAKSMLEMIHERKSVNQKHRNCFLLMTFDLMKGLYGGGAIILFSLMTQTINYNFIKGGGFFLSALVSLLSSIIFCFLWLERSRAGHRQVEEQCDINAKDYVYGHISYDNHLKRMSEIFHELEKLQVQKIYVVMIYFLALSPLLAITGILI